MAMRRTRRASLAALTILLAMSLAACGSSKKSTGRGAPTGGGAAAPGAPNASEAQAAATGDIPDNQVFLTFKDAGAGYSILYPEGWARRGGANDITFQDKANVIHVVISKGGPQTPADVQADLKQLKASNPRLKAGAPQKLTIKGLPVIKVTYTSESTPNPVTGKRVALTVDRYYYASRGKRATLDLETPVGVDNVDAYRMISRSFKWL